MVPSPLLRIIDDLYIVRTGNVPLKTDAPLRIETNRILSFPAASKGFQMIGRQCPKVSEAGSSFEDAKVLFGFYPERLPSGNPMAIREKLGPYSSRQSRASRSSRSLMSQRDQTDQTDQTDQIDPKD
jgi:hypothetical protein